MTAQASFRNVTEITSRFEHLIKQPSLNELRQKNRSHRATMLTIFLTQFVQIYLLTERSKTGSYFGHVPYPIDSW